MKMNQLVHFGNAGALLASQVDDCSKLEEANI
jgi:hypothetical protein